MKQSLWYKACNFSDSKKRVHLRLGPQTNSIGNSRDKRSSTKTISFKCILVFVSADFHTFSDSSEKNLMEKCDQAEMVFTAYITLKNGNRLYAKQVGKKAFCFPRKETKEKTSK